MICLAVACSPPSISENTVVELASVELSEASEVVQQEISKHQAKVKENPTDAQLIGELGVMYELHGFSAQALTAYALASQLNKDESRWPYYEAILLSARFDAERALERLDSAIALNPEYGPAWLNKGNIELDRGNFSGALSAFERAEDLSDEPYAYVGQSLALFGLQDYQVALNLLNQAEVINSHPDVIRLRARILIAQGNRDTGSKLLDGLPRHVEPVLFRDPVAEEKAAFSVENFSSQLADITALIKESELQAALNLIFKLRESRPTNKHLLNLLSDTYELLQQPDQALRILSLGIEHHPEFYPLRTSAARILRSQGELVEALVHLDAAIEFEPQLSWAYTYKAQILMTQKNWLSAIEVLDQAIRIDPEDVDLYTHLGISLGFLNRWPEASYFFKQAVALDETHVPSYLNLVRAHTILGNEEEALSALESAREQGASQSQLSDLIRQREQIKQMQIEIEQR